MKYRRIDKDTVQCIVTGEDLKELGLSMTDIFERNERGEGFLRDLIEEAHQEVGYTCSGNNIAMQITPFKDNGMIITFSEEPESTFKSFLEHMKGILQSAGIDGIEDIDALHAIGSKEISDKNEHGKYEKDITQISETRMFEFDELERVIEFAKINPNPSQVKSCLVKADEKYYLVLLKNRMSWKNYNKLTGRAFDYGNVVFDSDDKLIYLGEHGDVIIENGALNKLSKL